MNVSILNSNRNNNPLVCARNKIESSFLRGHSQESEIVKANIDEVFHHYYCVPFSRFNLNPFHRFSVLHNEWKAAVENISDLDQICSHPAYQQIIGMGETILPAIFGELRTAPDYWFWALKAITGEDPVPEEHQGRMKLMVEDWLKWGAQFGYV